MLTIPAHLVEKTVLEIPCERTLIIRLEYDIQKMAAKSVQMPVCFFQKATRIDDTKRSAMKIIRTSSLERGQSAEVCKLSTL